MTAPKFKITLLSEYSAMIDVREGSWVPSLFQCVSLYESIGTSTFSWNHKAGISRNCCTPRMPVPLVSIHIPNKFP